MTTFQPEWRTRRLVALVAAVVAVVAAWVGIPVPASPAAAEPVASSGRGAVAGLPAGAVDVGVADPQEPISLRVALAPRDQRALDDFAVAVSTPGSPVYGQYLTTAQFRARFGADSGAVAAVRRRVEQAGLPAGAVTADGLSFDVETTVGAAARGLDTHFVRTRLRDGRVVRRHDRPELLPAGALAVIGLDDLPRSHAAVSADPIPRTACPGATATAGREPSELATAYDAGALYDRTVGGTGQTVALYELSAYRATDITAAQQCYGSRGTVSRVAVDGGATTSTGALEVTLDADVVLGQAPFADVIVYEAPNTGAGSYDAFRAIVNDNRAQVVSISWGLCERLLTKSVAQAESNLFAQAAAQGQSVVAASGDDGSADCVGADNSTALAVDDPASQPYVTGVGGTSLTSVSPRAETVWNDSYGAGGGGISSVWPAPSYQAGKTTVDSSGVPCGLASGVCRQVPDVAASAAPATGYPTYCTTPRYCGGGWVTVGGTSGAAPLWAGLLAVTNEYCGAGSRVGFANPKLYAAGAGLNDILLGTNDHVGVNGGRYAAGPGYDMASGLGTPDAAPLAFDLCGAPPAGGKLTPAPAAAAFDATTTGSSASRTVHLRSTGDTSVSIGALTLTGDSASFAVVADGCSGQAAAPTQGCDVTVSFAPSTTGARSADLVVPVDAGTLTIPLTGTGVTAPPPTTTTTAAPTTTTTAVAPTTTTTTAAPPAAPAPAPARPDGYWMIGRTGSTYAFGGARWYGDTNSAAEVVDLEPTPDGGGYWTVDAAGSVFSLGNAGYFGGSPGLAPFERVTSISRTRSGRGYWLFSSLGRVFAYGDAPFLGDMAGIRLNGPVLDSIPTASGAGYYMVASDGGIFTFGDAVFAGSMGGQHLNAPVQSLVPDPDGVGYWLVASDGGIFAFDAPFYGSMGAVRLNRPITGMVASRGAGYLMVGEDGGIFTFGDATFAGSLGDAPPSQPITSVASVP